MTEAESGAWTTGISAITLFVEDVAAAKEFYSAAFGLPVHFEDADSAVFKFGETLVNLLRATEATELIEPQPVAPPNAGSRFQLTVAVDDVDATCAELRRCLAVPSFIPPRLRARPLVMVSQSAGDSGANC